MGKLTYGTAGNELHLDDRTLAHLQQIIYAKFLRDESFPFSWTRPLQEGSGRQSIWLHPAIALRFSYSNATIPPLNRAWLRILHNSANSAGGLRLVDEPAGD